MPRHEKIAEALIMEAISIEGGNYCLGKGYCRRQKRRLQNMKPVHAESSIAITNSRGISLDKMLFVPVEVHPQPLMNVLVAARDMMLTRETIPL